MPLLDHFHPPISDLLAWESCHSSWASRLADALNDRWLPEGFLAFEQSHAGSLTEIDVATFERTVERTANRLNGKGGTAILEPEVWAPPEPALTLPSIVPDSYSVRIYRRAGGLTLVASVELVSPGNKDRPDRRKAFATKCASFLYQGISLIIMDVVTTLPLTCIMNLCR